MKHLFELRYLKWSFKLLVDQVLQYGLAHFSSDERRKLYYVKRLQVVDDQISRCDDAAAKNDNLIGIFMGIASLQESRTAVEESISVNAVAGSYRRVTILTFVYLPLTLASVRPTPKHMSLVLTFRNRV